MHVEAIDPHPLSDGGISPVVSSGQNPSVLYIRGETAMGRSQQMKLKVKLN